MVHLGKLSLSKYKPDVNIILYIFFWDKGICEIFKKMLKFFFPDSSCLYIWEYQRILHHNSSHSIIIIFQVNWSGNQTRLCYINKLEMMDTQLGTLTQLCIVMEKLWELLVWTRWRLCWLLQDPPQNRLTFSTYSVQVWVDFTHFSVHQLSRRLLSVLYHVFGCNILFQVLILYFNELKIIVKNMQFDTRGKVKNMSAQSMAN